MAKRIDSTTSGSSGDYTSTPEPEPVRLIECPKPRPAARTFTDTADISTGAPDVVGKPLAWRDKARAAIDEYTTEMMGGTPAAPPSDDQWVLVSVVLPSLSFIGNYAKLKSFAKKYPEKLRLRRHPQQKNRSQVHAGDVVRLQKEHADKKFKDLDDDIDTVSIADSLAQLRARK